MLQYVYGLLDLAEANNILDIGCGDGYDLWQISKLAPVDCHFCGLDMASKAIQAAQAEKLFDNRFSFSVHDVSQDLPFEDGQFDVVFSKNVLECIPDKFKHLQEIHRVLSNNGQIIVSHFDWDSQTVDGDDKEFIRKMVHCFGDWQQDWMAASDAWMGRRLWSTFNSSQLFAGEIQTYVLTNTEFCSPYYGYERIRDFGSLAEKAFIDREKYDQFCQEMEARSQRGEYFYSIVNYIYLGRKK
jgi:ubiquinone/menaquinone biosynthesis C-methylase UbiE